MAGGSQRALIRRVVSSRCAQVIDRQFGMCQAAQIGQFRADQAIGRLDIEGVQLALQQRAGAAAEVEGRSRIAQRLQVGDGSIFKYADAHGCLLASHSTVTLLAKFLGLSTSQPRSKAMW